MSSLPDQFKLADEILNRLKQTKVAAIKYFHPQFENTKSALHQLIEDKLVKLTDDKQGLVITPKGEFFDGYDKFNVQEKQLKNLQLEISILQKRELRTKWIWAVAGWIIGIGCTLVTTYLTGLLKLNQ